MLNLIVYLLWSLEMHSRVKVVSYFVLHDSGNHPSQIAS